MQSFLSLFWLLALFSFLQDEDFVVDKDDGGSPTDDSGDESDASESGGEKEASYFPWSVLELCRKETPMWYLT